MRRQTQRFERVIGNWKPDCLDILGAQDYGERVFLNDV